MSDESVPSPPATFDITQSAGRSQVRREIIRLFRTTELSPREILHGLFERFYAAPVSEQDRRTFFQHATIWVREEALIRGAAATPKPNTYSELLDAFHYLERTDPSGARILDLAYVAELEPNQIGGLLDIEPDLVSRKLQSIQTWLRRVAEGEPLTSYQSNPG
jgi:hypothetical protein